MSESKYPQQASGVDYEDNMRLSQAQVHAIEQVFQMVFLHGEVILFGSRVDDQKKGGDIDLFVQPASPMSDLFARKIRFLLALKNKIGEQKIDLVLAPFAPEELKCEIKRTGILLCRI